MPRKALIVKSNKVSKYSTRKRPRCLVCGRARGNFRLYRFYKEPETRLCRISIREWIYQGRLPGIKKSSW